MVRVQKVKNTYSWKDVAKHNTLDDAWVSIDGKVCMLERCQNFLAKNRAFGCCVRQVYDVTDWKDSHPGGKDILAIAAGMLSLEIGCTASMMPLHRRHALKFCCDALVVCMSH